jgi:hypothetical protein
MGKIFKEAQSQISDAFLDESVKSFKPGSEFKVGDMVQTPWGKKARITKVRQEPDENGYSGYYNLENDAFCHLGISLRKI